LRAAQAQGTPVGEKIKKVMSEGKLVDDGLVIDLVAENIDSPACSGGFILDGFPRTLAQAEALDKMLKVRGLNLDRAFEFRIPDSLLFERITGRWIHKESGRSYHVKYAPPKVQGIDDVTGQPLMQRPDDTVDVLKTRLAAYHDQTSPLVDFYDKQNLLTVIDAQRSPQYVYAQIQAGLAFTRFLGEPF